jgi:hypothetical protein
MNEPDFWTSYGQAMELRVEGNRLIAQQIATWVRGLWRRVIESVPAQAEARPHTK